MFYFTFSCVETGENSPPDDLIPPDQMCAVMVDILIMKNIKREYAYIKEKQNLLHQNTFMISIKSIVNNWQGVSPIMQKPKKIFYYF